MFSLSVIQRVNVPPFSDRPFTSTPAPLSLRDAIEQGPTVAPVSAEGENRTRFYFCWPVAFGTIQ